MSLNLDKVESTPLNPTEKKRQKVACFDEYYSYKTKKKEFITTSQLDKICDDLVDWVTREEEALKIKQFIALKGIPYGTWHNWIEKSEKLKMAVEQAKMIIGNRREVGAITRKFDSGNTMFMMPHYDHDWEQMLRLRAEISEKKDGSKGPGWVVLEKMPETELVKRKEELDGK